jgi:hypothetical protein
MRMSATDVTAVLTVVIALFASHATVAALFYSIGKDVATKGNKKR